MIMIIKWIGIILIWKFLGFNVCHVRNVRLMQLRKFRRMMEGMISRTSFRCHTRVPGILDVSFLRARIPFLRLTCDSFCYERSTASAANVSSRIAVHSCAPYLLPRSAFGCSIISEETSQLYKRQRRGDAFIPSCLRKIRPLVRRNLNTTRTRRGRVYYVPWHVRRFDIQENWQLPFRKIHDLLKSAFRLSRRKRCYVDAFSLAALTDVTFFWESSSDYLIKATSG